MSTEDGSQPLLHWTEGDAPCSARWRSERDAPPPKRVVLADDTMPADTAYRLACEGTGLLWRGDFHNARQLLLALARRVDRKDARRVDRKDARRIDRKAVRRGTPPAAAAPVAAPAAAPAAPGAAFHLHRQAQSQRARVLSMLLIPLDADHGIPLRRAPDHRLACTEAWGPAETASGPGVVALRELLGVVSAFEWRKKGVPVPALGPAPDNRIHPHHGVFSPLRGEYIDLVAQAPLPMAADTLMAFDIGTGTAVLAAVLARRGVARVLATELEPRALACARDNLDRLGLAARVTLLHADLFPPGRAGLVVCNPPWLPARPGAAIERAVYDEDSRMLKGYLAGLLEHLAPGGEGWLILSDLAEHLGLRTRAELLGWFEAAGLRVLGRIDVRPTHGKAVDASDPLHAARAAEVTSLWRLVARGA